MVSESFGKAIKKIEKKNGLVKCQSLGSGRWKKRGTKFIASASLGITQLAVLKRKACNYRKYSIVLPGVTVGLFKILSPSAPLYKLSEVDALIRKGR